MESGEGLGRKEGKGAPLGEEGIDSGQQTGTIWLLRPVLKTREKAPFTEASNSGLGDSNFLMI